MGLYESWQDAAVARVHEAVSKRKRDLPFVERLRKSLERNKPILNALRPDDHRPGHADGDADG